MDLSTILLANRLIFHFRMAQMERRKKNGAKERGEPKFDRSTVKTEVLKLSLWCKQQHASDLVYNLQHQIDVRHKNRKYSKGKKISSVSIDFCKAFCLFGQTAQTSKLMVKKCFFYCGIESNPWQWMKFHRFESNCGRSSSKHTPMNPIK